MIKKIQGITLLEAVLALAIASSIALLGIRQYTQFKFNRDAFALKYNVDTLFQGMRNYYYANCAESTDVNMSLHTLAPSRNPSNPFPIKIIPTLNNYLDTKWSPFNPLLDTTFVSGGYETQFNNVVFLGDRKENFCYYYPGTSQTFPICATMPNTNARIYLWVAQVVVKLKDPKLTLALKGLTGADCALTKYTPSSVVDCTQGVTTGNPAYLVWQHLPSYVSPELSSGLWRATSAVKGFNLQYTNDSYYELVSETYEGTKYYLCGG